MDMDLRARATQWVSKFTKGYLDRASPNHTAKIIRELLAEIKALEKKLDSPEIDDFLEGVKLEAGMKGGNIGAFVGSLSAAAKRGVRKGVADYFLAVPKGGMHGLWLELKAPGGSLKNEQALFLADMREMGYATAVAWGHEGAEGIIINYMDEYLGGATFAANARDCGPLAGFTLTGTLRVTRAKGVARRGGRAGA